MSGVAILGQATESPEWGGKALALDRMMRVGLPVPRALCLTASCYRRFLLSDGLQEQIGMELSRKPLDEMRWEEMWDASLRLRTAFSRAPFPEELQAELEQAIRSEGLDQIPVSVRSSSLAEDSTQTSFAGLHESFLNLVGLEEILNHVRLVWASLWSDSALLYRKELKLEVENSAMAVVVQEMVAGEVSGIGFSRAPSDPELAVVEAVHGLNEGLVSGAIEPDRWFLRRKDGYLVRNQPAAREDYFVSQTGSGVARVPLPEELKSRTPCDDELLQRVFGLIMECEREQGDAQDVEWTSRDRTLYLLQARPITTGKALSDSEEKGDKRAWYLSLKKSLASLKELRSRIEEERLPAMTREADKLEQVSLPDYQDGLAEVLALRLEAEERWTAIYWNEYIPFAHGIRLFGMVYNDQVKPEDPYEFVGLLAGQRLLSLDRNQKLMQLAESLKTEPGLLGSLRQGTIPPDSPQSNDIQNFLEEFAVRLGGRESDSETCRRFVGFLLEMNTGEAVRAPSRQEISEESFLLAFPEERRDFAREILDLGRASYRLRDDDNLYLERFRRLVKEIVAEAVNRYLADETSASDWTGQQVLEWLRTGKSPDRDTGSNQPSGESAASGPSEKVRQQYGQPAGPGYVEGPARVVRHREDLLAFRKGEVLVCDAIDPSMTFVVPLAAGIVERRGGMLIHGAIIAREYGIPCVTGVPNADRLVETGERVCVDGFLGLVTFGEP
ncbi:PEP/pyruvate-binding domain-containing protein [Thiohalomonas denitrificans]|uniref:PEP/pyruvate-binding domain-containing protein n=1 Tax=Thiohalomonas denitrificans TaxID=415747 RepID=UPI0039838EEC